MRGDYPSTDFDIAEDGDTRRVTHLPTGMKIETTRSPADPVAVSPAHRIELEGYVARPQEVAQAALRHLRVWLIHRYAKGTI